MKALAGLAAAGALLLAGCANEEQRKKEEEGKGPPIVQAISKLKDSKKQWEKEVKECGEELLKHQATCHGN